MARQVKIGLDFFSLDTNFLQDIKVRRILRSNGVNAIAILIYLLGNIYKEKGYYMKWDVDCCFLIADVINMDEKEVQEVVQKSLEVDFFNKTLYERYKILTSEDIQKKYVKQTKYINKEIITKPYTLICNEKIPMYKLDYNRRIYNLNKKKWNSLRITILERDNYTCVYCGDKNGPFELDHAIPFSRGGSDTIENLVTSCRRCNRRKKDKTPKEFRKWVLKNGK